MDENEEDQRDEWSTSSEEGQEIMLPRCLRKVLVPCLLCLLGAVLEAIFAAGTQNCPCTYLYHAPWDRT
jgi:hypothetical protein